jgi:hypothetical protein
MDRHRKLPESRCAGISQCSAQESNLARTLSGPPQNLRVPWQTYTFTCTFSEWHKITCFIYSYLDTNEKHLKSADLNRLWGFKSPLRAPAICRTWHSQRFPAAASRAYCVDAPSGLAAVVCAAEPWCSCAAFSRSSSFFCFSAAASASVT